MSQIVYEVLDGGLVTNEAPSRLQPGELVQATNALYYPWREGPGSIPAITSWSVVASANQEVSGLTSARFDNGEHYLVAQASGKYWLADAETDLSAFTSATTVTAGNQLAGVEYDNRFYVFNGSGENLVLQQGGTFRKHGLLPVTTKMTDLGTVASAFSGSATGFYEYWFTEVVKFADNSELESAYDTTPLTVNVTSLSAAPNFEMPSRPNNYGEGTHISYRVYRSEKKALQNDSLYPVGTKLFDVSTTNNAGTPINRIFFADTGTTSNTGNKVSGSNNSVVTKGVATSSLVGGAASVSDAASATGDGKLWRVSATASASSVILGMHGAVVTLYNFSPGTITGNIAGIEVVVRAAASVASIGDVWVSVGKRDDATHGLIPFPRNLQYPLGLQTAIYQPANGGALGIRPDNSRIAKRKTVVETVLGAAADMTFGGSTDTWIPPEYGWTLDQFGSDFSVQLAVTLAPNAVAGNTIDVDYVRINIYYTGTNGSAVKGKIYDAITVEQGGAELKFSANGKPPVASTGAIFEGSLVTDDVANPGKLVWSVPNFPDYFPTGVYFNVLGTGDNDVITFIGVVNEKLIVGTKGSLWRVNYLPNELDASFSRGRAVSLISDKVGILRPTTGCLFTNADGHQELAFVDTNGVFATNGYTVRSLSEDLRWVNFADGVFLVISSSIYTSVKGLVNDPTTQTLRLVLGTGYYAATYAARHKKMSRDRLRMGMKWSGPATATLSGAQPASAHVLRRNNGVWLVVYGYKSGSGAVAREDGNDSATYGTSPAMTLETREIFPVQVGSEVSLDSLIVEGNDLGSGASAEQSPSWTATIEQHFANAGNPTDVVLTHTGGVEDVTIMEVPCGSVNANGFAITLQPTSALSGRVEIRQIGMALTPFGEAELRA